MQRFVIVLSDIHPVVLVSRHKRDTDLRSKETTSLESTVTLETGETLLLHDVYFTIIASGVSRMW